MAGQGINQDLDVRGLLKRIVSYKTCCNSTIKTSGHRVCDTKITTQLELLTDDGKNLPIQFQSYVGPELVDKRVTYSCRNHITLGSADFAKSHAKQEETVQELIPDEENLPKYLAVSCIYQA